MPYYDKCFTNRGICWSFSGEYDKIREKLEIWGGKEMRIVVFSDSHYNVSRMEKVLNTIIGIDAVIHCGDGKSDLDEVAENHPNIKFYGVRGNCDNAFSKGEELLTIEGKNIFVTHGHLYNVKTEIEWDYPTLRDKGRELGADAVVFGHTHIPYNKNWGDIVVMNPGSIKYSGTYGVIEIEGGKLKTATLNLF